MSLNISTSSVSSPSSASSHSPAPPATPLTPPASVNFNLPGQQGDQYAFDLDASLANNGAANNAANAGGAVRRKPSRRANTAERRATHNAVERQRRETLNGRFLDLAALLPNLASVRRPSKSAIVNSSIALIHTQRRARASAARELRLLKLEADQLRAELNEWREGSGVARVEEPLRSRDFEELVSGVLEESEEGLIEEERRALEIVKEGLRMDASGLGGSEVLTNPFAYNMPAGGMGMYGGLAEDDDEDTSSDSHSGRMRPGSQGSSVNGAVPTLPLPIPVSRNNAAAAQPMIFDPNSAFLQAHPTHNASITGFPSYDMNGLNGLGPISPAGLNHQSQEKLAAWNTQIYGLPGQQNQYHPAMNVFTSPASAHPVNNFVGYPTADDSDNTASSLGSDIHHHAHAAHHLHAQMAVHRSRSVTSVKAGSPPTSAPPTVTSFSEGPANVAGDAFAAAYNAYPKVSGGGNTYGAVMGLFM